MATARPDADLAAWSAYLTDEIRVLPSGVVRYHLAAPSDRWAELLRKRDPALRVRRNYPYRGAADGLPTWLRRRFPARVYLGVELEANQAYLAGPRRAELARALAETLAVL